MTRWLIQRFVKNPDQVQDESVRLNYGTLSSLTGIVCNLILFAVKILIGVTMHAVSVLSDAFNNLSDCFSCIITLFGYRLAAKPADKEHPFGHGRIEYLISMVVSIFIFVVGWELLRQSIDQIRTPSPISFSWPLLLALVVTIFVKLWMANFNRTIGNRIHNTAMIATAQDSRNDVLVTAVTIGAMLLAFFFPDVPFDGIAGVIVAVFIFLSGYSILSEIVDQLLGKPVSSELVEKIEAIMRSHPEIIGIHDLLVHDYGPGMMIGSVHAEVDASMNFMAAHDVIDEAEREIQEQLHIIMTIHMDPVDLSDPERNSYRKKIKHALEDLDPSLQMHDFRMVTGPTHTNLVFDVVIPYDSRTTKDQVRSTVNAVLAREPEKLYAVITFDQDFTEHDDR